MNQRAMREFLRAPGPIRKMVISDHQIKIVKTVRGRKYRMITSRELADSLEISVQSATAQLRRLSEIGYLTRTERPDPTGGKIYLYRFAL